MYVSRNTSYCRQKFLQQNIPVILSVNLRSGVHKYEFIQCIQVLILPTDTISDWLKVARVPNSRLAEVFFFLKERATYRRYSAYFTGKRV